MIVKLNMPEFDPWSKKSGWESFGEKYDSVEFKYKSLSEPLQQWLFDRNLSFTGGNMLTIFPDKNPPTLIDGPWCKLQSYARLYWVYDAPVKITSYELTEPYGEENYENILGMKPSCEEDLFTDKLSGWYPKPELLKETGTFIVEPNNLYLVDAGMPFSSVAVSPVRAKIFAISLDKTGKKNPYLFPYLEFETSKEFFAGDICSIM